MHIDYYHEYYKGSDQIPRTEAHRINERMLEVNLSDSDGSIRRKIRLVSRDSECISKLQNIIEKYDIYGGIVDKQSYMDNSGHIRNKPEDLVECNLNDLINKKWEQIVGLLENKYEMSPIITEVWIAALKIYRVENKKVYFGMDERRGIQGVNYLTNKGYDKFLLSAIKECLNDDEIELEIKVYDEKGNY